MRALLLTLALSLAAAAQPAETSAPAPDAEARVLLAAGDSSRALRAVEDAIRDHPDDAALRRLRLRLHVAGIGLSALPRFARHQQIVDDAEALRRRALSDTLALRVLVDDAVWTVLSWQDRVQPGAVRNIYGDFVSPAEVRARTSDTRFDLDDRRAMAPDLDRSGRARDAHRDALGWLDTWLAADPASPRAYASAAVLATVTEAWDGLAALAARYRRAVPADPRADLYAGLAAYRSGDAEAAEAAFDRALARLAPAGRRRFEEVRYLLATDQRAAYDARPEAVTAAFWAAADPRLLTAVNERRVEHVARVVEADLLFGHTADDLFTDEPRRGADTDQGQLWIRYGRPAETVRFFLDDTNVQAYGDDKRFAVWDFDDFTFVFDDPENDGGFRTYSPPASAFAGSASSAMRDDFVMQDERMQREDPQRTQDAPAVPLDVPALVSRFRAPGGGLDVVAGWGIPVADVTGPVQTGAFALAGGSVVDRVIGERPRLAAGRMVEAGGARVWAEGAVVQLSGPGEVRVEVEAQGGEAFGSAAVPVEALAGGGLSVSDVLLALAVDAEGRGPVVRDGLGIVPAPRAAFATGDPVWVVVEAYGLNAPNGRSRYTVEATMRPQARRGGLLGRILGRGQGPGVSVRTEGDGAGATETISFFLDVSDQRPGRYTLTVTVADAATGATASAEREVTLE